jgi:tetratricopeptide (TPR) repeat protein
LAINPDYAEAHNGLGNTHQRFGRLEEAAACYERALQLKPEYADARVNLGISWHNRGRLSEAIANYEQVLQRNPSHGDAHLSRAFAWLVSGDFERGWPEYEWRWRNKQMTRREFRQPEWDGRPLVGKTILLHAEQGLGDTIQFIRYAPLVKRLAGRVIVECQEQLLPLLARCQGVDEWVGHGLPLPSFDVQAPLLSLPRLFRTSLKDIPAETPYLFAGPDLVNQWRDWLRALDGFKIGIAWQGNTAYRGDHFRSIPVGQFAPLARIREVCLISLQKGDGAEQLGEGENLFRVMDFSRQLDQQGGAFTDTAAVMMNLDLVVTSDSAIAHLAGALGVPVWVALPLVPDWRWLLDRDDCPWYPTMRLFRQTRLGDWEEVFQRIATEVEATAAGDRSHLLPRAGSGTPPIYAPIAPGELLDKIAILQIKRTRISDPQKLRNVHTELAQLCSVRDRVIVPSAELAKLSSQLAAANEKLWEIEDQIRECEAKKDFGPRFVELARAVYVTNDERAAIKRQINELLGSSLIEEKAYIPYG